jgi:hypothetical protein
MEDEAVLRVWNVAAGTVVATFTGDSSMSLLDCSSTGELLVAREVSGRVHVLRLEGLSAADPQRARRLPPKN